MSTTLTIPAGDVHDGYWDIDAEATHAILLDDGQWYRSWDASVFGAMYGWDRVAVIEEDVTPTANPDLVTASDVSTDTYNGIITLSVMYAGQRIKQRYLGYTHADAMRAFLDDVNGMKG